MHSQVTQFPLRRDVDEVHVTHFAHVDRYQSYTAGSQHHEGERRHVPPHTVPGIGSIFGPLGSLGDTCFGSQVGHSYGHHDDSANPPTGQAWRMGSGPEGHASPPGGSAGATTIGHSESRVGRCRRKRLAVWELVSCNVTTWHKGLDLIRTLKVCERPVQLYVFQELSRDVSHVSQMVQQAGSEGFQTCIAASRRTDKDGLSAGLAICCTMGRGMAEPTIPDEAWVALAQHRLKVVHWPGLLPAGSSSSVLTSSRVGNFYSKIARCWTV